MFIKEKINGSAIVSKTKKKYKKSSKSFVNNINTELFNSKIDQLAKDLAEFNNRDAEFYLEQFNPKSEIEDVKGFGVKV